MTWACKLKYARWRTFSLIVILITNAQVSGLQTNSTCRFQSLHNSLQQVGTGFYCNFHFHLSAQYRHLKDEMADAASFRDKGKSSKNLKNIYFGLMFINACNVSFIVLAYMSNSICQTGKYIYFWGSIILGNWSSSSMVYLNLYASVLYLWKKHLQELSETRGSGEGLHQAGTIILLSCLYL